MKRSSKILKTICIIFTYLLVVAVAVYITFMVTVRHFSGITKLDELESLLKERFIGEVDQTAIEDGAAAGMIAALGDQWSYYIPASEYKAHKEQLENAYVGVGITVAVNEETKYIDIRQVDPNGGAKEAGILPGDVLIDVEGQDVSKIGLNKATELIRGEEDTTVTLTVLRGEEKKPFTVTRKKIMVQVAKGQMLEDKIGYVKIVNFDARCAQETTAVIEDLLEQGAESLVFDVRFNPGGFQTELVALLDYLLPEGEIFRSVYYTGHESVDRSDSKCLDVPMAVLINGDSYSAAEFFAAALNEYDKAILVGEATTGKGYFQTTYTLKDGSAANISIGKYFTPKGACLAEVGGLKPEVEVKVDKTTATGIYAGTLAVEKDPQIQAAVEALKKAS